MQQKPFSAKDNISLRQFHQELKDLVIINRLWNTSTIIWKPVKSHYYTTTLCLPHYVYGDNLRQEFFKVTRNSNLLDWNINLIGLADWLEGRLKTCFNPLTEIIALQDQANLSKLHYNTNSRKSKFNNS